MYKLYIYSLFFFSPNLSPDTLHNMMLNIYPPDSRLTRLHLVDIALPSDPEYQSLIGSWPGTIPSAQYDEV